MSDSDDQSDNVELGNAGPDRLFGDENRTNEDVRLLNRAIRNGWIQRRWNTRKPKKQIVEEVQSAGDVTMADVAELAQFKLLSSADLHEVAWGVRLAVAMERQNQVDELHAMKTGSDPARPQPTTRMPDQTTIEMDMTIPFVPDKEAQ
jgi:hypothetical protein